jgi:signal transduction histidine kinase
LSRPQDQHSRPAAAAGATVYQQIAVLNQQAWELSDTDARQALALSTAAYDLASAPGPVTPPDQEGIAYSLRTQGYLNMRLGDYPLGLSQLTRALAIFEALDCTDGIFDGLADVYDGLAGIYAQIGSYPEALEYMHKQLSAAERIGDMRRVANAYNNLVHVYVELGQHERAIATLQRNLQLGIEIPYPRIECLSYLNLAETYLLTGAYTLARENALVGLRRSQEEGFEVFVVYGYEILGKACRLLGDISQSLQYLDEALAASRRMSSLVTEVVILLELGQTNRAADRFSLARTCLEQGIAVARTIDARSEQAAAHLQLSELYEQLGDTGQALAHFKQHQALKELVSGEKANQRLQVLQVAHDTELAQKEAGHLRSLNDRLEHQVAERTAELTATVALLQKEIGERERAEAEIQQMVATLEQRVAARTDELATFFDLSLLAGEGSDLADVFEQALPRIMEVSRSRVICLHLLDPGHTAEHTALRLAGQQNVPGAAQASLALVPIAAGFQRWLQQPNDPLLTTNLGTKIGPAALLPAAFRLPGYRTYLGAQVKIGGRAGGLLSCYRLRDRGYGIDEIALVTALAEQIGLMLETQRLRRQAEEMAILAERQRLARDLHDSVTQSLYSLTLFSRAGREAAADGDAQRLQESLASLERNTLHALREMRLLLYELRPADLEHEGLQRALELRLNTVERRAGLQLDVQIDLPHTLPPSCESDLYHIVVEALNNVVKHAAAGHVTLVLKQAGEQPNRCLHLVIADDGRGFDPVRNTPGLGLNNMRERVARLHGEITITGELGRGTTVAAVLPWPMGSG